MDRVLKRPQIYLLYFVGLTTAAYVGAVVGMLVVLRSEPVSSVTFGKLLAELNPIACGWLWLPCLIAATFARGIVSVFAGTISRYSKVTQHTRPGWVLLGFCLATLVGSAVYAWYFLTLLSYS